MSSQREDTPREDTATGKPLRVEMWLFFAVMAFFLIVGIVYAAVTGGEPVGTWALLLLVGLYGMVGVYLFLVGRKVDPRPEDDPLADVDQHPGEIGVFAPHSWWPLVLGVAVTLVFGGVAMGWWITGLGFAVGLVGLVGHTYEFSRGQHAH